MEETAEVVLQAIAEETEVVLQDIAEETEVVPLDMEATVETPLEAKVVIAELHSEEAVEAHREREDTVAVAVKVSDPDGDTKI